MTDDVLLSLKNICKEYPSGEDTVSVLKDINLEIKKGEMVAIVGASGSGKSTLMNILGCLDRPTKGVYEVNSVSVDGLDPDDLAALRREYFGFIFQRYHLLSDLTALGNVEIPAIYSGENVDIRHERAKKILDRVGLSDKIDHKPSQLSGGQQQRVSIARALMNGGDVILADEPTGALDSQSGENTMSLLKDLHNDGHTVILVTHDLSVASYADRIIEIKDGEIIRDEYQSGRVLNVEKKINLKSKKRILDNFILSEISRFGEALKMALLAMNAHRLRTFLTMLGIIIGIASVVSVVALGRGSQERVLSDISSIATNTIDIRKGSGFGDRQSYLITTLTDDDVSALSREYYIDSVTPHISTSINLRKGNEESSGSLSGVGVDYIRVQGYEMSEGVWFSDQSVNARAQDVVIDDNTRKKFFSENDDNVLGSVIFLGDIPARIVGVTKPRNSAFGNNDSLNVWVPYTTLQTRLLRQNYLDRISVRIDNTIDTVLAEQKINNLLLQRHGKKDFFTINTDTIRETIQKTTQTLTLLISSIAIISLIVGGIGVMNIMLVSVTERTSEIGVRMAVGARQGDILRQFLIEATLICLLGGLLGIFLALFIGVLFDLSGLSIPLIYSANSMILACICSSIIGIVFGFLPARSAAKLDPVTALSRD